MSGRFLEYLRKGRYQTTQKRKFFTFCDIISNIIIIIIRMYAHINFNVICPYKNASLYAYKCMMSLSLSPQGTKCCYNFINCKRLRCCISVCGVNLAK